MYVNSVGNVKNYACSIDELKKKNQAANLLLISGAGLGLANHLLDKELPSFAKNNPKLALMIDIFAGIGVIMGLSNSLGASAKIKELKNQINVNA